LLTDTSRVHRISQLADFLEIPDDELAGCLRAFKAWIREQKDLRANASRGGGVTRVTSAAEFVWKPVERAPVSQAALSPQTDIRELGLRPAALYRFLELNIFALEDFSAISEADLYLPKVGAATITSIREKLLAVGLDFLPPANAVRRALQRSKVIRSGAAATPILDDSCGVAELGLKTYALKRLLSKGVESIGQLRAMTAWDFFVIFGNQGCKEVYGSLRRNGLDLASTPSTLELWRHGLLDSKEIQRPGEIESVLALQPWLGQLPHQFKRAGIDTVGALRAAAEKGQPVRGVGEYSWRRVRDFFGGRSA
jgi:hypothetical protein